MEKQTPLYVSSGISCILVASLITETLGEMCKMDIFLMQKAHSQKKQLTPLYIFISMIL